jgi:hypothetical protein
MPRLREGAFDGAGPFRFDPSMPLARRALAIALGLLAAACGSSSSGGSTTSTSTATTTVESVCASDPRATPFAEGMTVKSADGAVAVRVDHADPAPPTKGTDALSITVLDGAGKPLDGATVALSPYMPDHRHGASVTPKVTAGAAPGAFDVADVELFMPGIWQLTFRVTPKGGAAHDAVLTLCVDG